MKHVYGRIVSLNYIFFAHNCHQFFNMQASLKLTVLLLLGFSFVNSASVKRAVTKELAPIDSAGKFNVEWIVTGDSIRFNLVVGAIGYIGFGFSDNGGAMNGADIVIGGVYKDDGRTYFGDRHGIGYTEPPLDTRQNYELHYLNQNQTHTSLGFSRQLDTGDDQDIPITDAEITLIWAIGTSDTIEFHRGERGIFLTNLLNP